MRSLAWIALVALGCGGGYGDPRVAPAGTPAPLVAAWRRLNEVRQAAGLRPVPLDRDLGHGALLHARYLTLNRVPPHADPSSPHPQIFTFSPHIERPDRPGYTDEGEEAGRKSCLSYDETPLESVDRFIASYHHRLPLLRRDLVAVGLASVASPGGRVNVLRLENDDDLDGATPRVYPLDGQRDVPLEMSPENPEPRPLEWFAGAPNGQLVSGFPVTIDFGSAVEVWGVTGSIRTAAGELIESHTTSMSMAFRTTGAVLPRAPLAPATTYHVEAAATVERRPWRARWSFTTRPAAPAR